MSGDVAAGCNARLAHRPPAYTTTTLCTPTMASQPHQAAPSDDAAPASLASLPDALLEHILGLLDQSDRC